ncbi:MAG: hypothetical protein KC900_06575 [Candidatus Omnitrophica bacterium]|nr:hypothetical protein [Candidatus Omnitrophota bacterium]
MNTETYNLIDGGIQNSNLFLHMPLFDEINYLGLPEPKLRKYRAEREDLPCTMLALNIIRKEEDFLWEAVSDFVKHSVATAAMGVHGVYVFDLLTIDIHQEIQNFNQGEFSTVIMNTARKLQPGQIRLVKYSSAYGILQKLVHEDWGKITLKAAVDVFKDKPHFLDLLIKRLIKNFDFAHDPGILLLNDLSKEPLFDAADATQQERIQKVIEKQIPKSIEFLPEVYIQDRNGVREMLSNSVIK